MSCSCSNKNQTKHNRKQDARITYDSKIIRIGLAGNPNAGKTTLFNAITGSHQKVGNYAGVTVEKKEGRKEYRGYELIIYDLPGTYSLTAYSADEVVARDFILEEKPDVIIDVIDSTNIERNLYFCLQLQELGIPVVGALNIIDQAESMGLDIDAQLLSELLRMPLIKTVGAKKKGLDELLDAVIAAAKRDICPICTEQARGTVYYGDEIEREIERIEKLICRDTDFCALYPPRWMAIKLIEKDKDAYKKLREHKDYALIEKEAARHINHLERHYGRDSEIIVSEQRYAYVNGAVAEAVSIENIRENTLTEKIDRVLLNRYLGLPMFLVFLWAIFQVTFLIGKYPQNWLEAGFGALGDFISGMLPAGLLRSLLVDGIIGGVGSVLSFVPLIIILFLLISILEDSGYMSRAAFIMDKFLHIFGLHGQSFLPMMLGFGCSVPAIMATRTLRSVRDRILTIMVVPLMSCGAKLPIYVLLAAAFFPRYAGNVVLSMYILGIILALVSAMVFKRTVFKGKSTPFVMELPPYRIPTARGIVWHIWDKTSHYFKKAGTVILLASMLIWAITTFPRLSDSQAQYDALVQQYTVSHANATNNEAAQYAKDALASAQMEHSIAGNIGKVIEPVIRPIGFDWKVGIAVITGFAAKEVVVSTLGVLYKVENSDNDANTRQSLGDALKKDKNFSPLIAYILMLFILINAPCFAALATIRAEIGWKWLTFSVSYNLLLAWIVCFVGYHIGLAMGL